jgi:excisionase family DNA binding protein
MQRSEAQTPRSSASTSRSSTSWPHYAVLRPTQQRAELFGTDRTTIVRWRHRHCLPTLDVAYRIAQTLGTSVDQLIEASRMTAPLLNKAQLAELLGVPVGWVDQATAAQTIPFTKIGKHIRFSETHVAAIVAAGEVKPTRSALRRRAAA